MNNLKSLRCSAKITQAALAREVRVTQGAIAHYESGRRTPRLRDCRRVVRALERLGVHCSLSDVFPDQAESSADHAQMMPGDCQSEQPSKPAGDPSSAKVPQ